MRPNPRLQRVYARLRLHFHVAPPFMGNEKITQRQAGNDESNCHIAQQKGGMRLRKQPADGVGIDQAAATHLISDFRNQCHHGHDHRQCDHRAALHAGTAQSLPGPT